MDDYFESRKSTQKVEEQIRQDIEINNAAIWQMHGCASNESSILKVISKNSNDESIELIKAE